MTPKEKEKRLWDKITELSDKIDTILAIIRGDYNAEDKE